MTNNCPKPMLKIGGRPVLETMIENLVQQGFRHLYLAVNFLADMIRDHFGDGSHFGAQIDYLQEQKMLGTAGALSLLPEQPDEPILVLNSDLLTKVNFRQLLDFHSQHKALGTMCVREYDFKVPFGVVKVEQHRLIEIEEKPVHKFFVNAGIYVLDPQVLKMIAPDCSFEMPSVFENLIEKNLETAVFPIREYWLDIGRIDDFERAKGEFSEVFK
jgi:NDP-sugar pyrophosphorylase family protein